MITDGDSMFRSLIEELSIPIVEERNYWLIRTEGGSYYLDFLFNNYVAIGWDEINIQTVKTQNNDKLKEIVKKVYPKEEAPWHPASKLQKFVNEIKKGDIVIIPGERSEKASIGIFIEDDAYEDKNYVERKLKENTDSNIKFCPFIKRRKVKWLNNIVKDRMDVYLSKLFNAHQAVFSANEYAQYIDRNIHNLYAKKDELHSIFHAGHQNGFSLQDLSDFVDFFNSGIKYISDVTGIEVDKKKIDMKLNIHSPGLIEVIAIGLAAATGISIMITSLNNMINGGKFRLSYKDPSNGKEISIESESPGFAGRKIENRKLDIEQQRILSSQENLKGKYLELKESVDLALPSVGNTDGD